MINVTGNTCSQPLSQIAIIFILVNNFLNQIIIFGWWIMIPYVHICDIEYSDMKKDTNSPRADFEGLQITAKNMWSWHAYITKTKVTNMDQKLKKNYQNLWKMYNIAAVPTLQCPCCPAHAHAPRVFSYLWVFPRYIILYSYI